ncbi:MAG: sigma-70 family RNA polymerase sigma factor [Planctomycetota bacterium]
MHTRLFPPTDATLVRRLRDGDSNAFEPLVLRYQSKGQAVARAQGAHSTTVDDVVQEAFFQAFRSFERLEHPERFGPWFLSIVRNIARKELRSADRCVVTSELEARADEPANTLESREISDRLWSEVRRLPDSVRESVFLYYHEGESTRRVARALGITTSDVKNRLRRGRELLRRELWRSLGASLRHVKPSATTQRQSARRLSLLVLSTFAVGSGTASAATASGALSHVPTAGVVTLSSKKSATWIAVCLLLFAAGYLGGTHSRSNSSPSQRVVETEKPPEESEHIAHVEPKIQPSPAAIAASKPSPPNEPATVKATHGSLLVTVLHSGRNETARDVGVLLRPNPRPSPSWKNYLSRSDENGDANFEHLPPGEYTINFDRSYPRGRWPRVQVTAGERTELRVRLPPGIRVQGQVVDSNERPVADATILVSRDEFDGFSATPLTKSDAEGRFEVAGAQNGRYVSARKDGYAPSRQLGLSANDGETKEIRLVLPRPGGSVSGQVIDSDGRPVENARVWVGELKMHHGQYDLRAAPVIVRTDTDGMYTATGVGVGTVPVAARAPGFAPKTGEVLVEPRRQTTLDLTLERGVTVEGVVRDFEGEPVKRAKLSVGEELHFVAGTDPFLTKTRSDEQGRYRLAGLAAGTILVRAERDGKGKAETSVVGKIGDRIELDIDLDPPLAIRGRVVYEDGTPVANAGIQTVGLYYVETDQDGRFQLTNCEDKEYSVRVSQRQQPSISCAEAKVRPGPTEVEIIVREEHRSTVIVEGRLVDSDGQPVANGEVQLQAVASPNGGPRSFVAIRGKSGPTGRFRVGPVPPRTYRIALSAKDWPRSWIGPRDLKGSRPVELGDVPLVRPGWLRVEFAGSAEVREDARAVITTEEDDLYLAATRLSSDTEWRQALVPGALRLIVRHRDRKTEITESFRVVEGKETVLRVNLENAAR